MEIDKNNITQQLKDDIANVIIKEFNNNFDYLYDSEGKDFATGYATGVNNILLILTDYKLSDFIK